MDVVITNLEELSRHYAVREGFLFTSIMEPSNIFDSIIIRNPEKCECWTPRTGFSERSLKEHIDFINHNKIEKALVIAENIDFIVKCPSLKYIRIIPGDTAGNGFDYSPLYEMPELRYLECRTVYGSMKEEKATVIDYSKISKEIENLHIANKGHLNWEKLDSLEKLFISDLKDFKDFRNVNVNRRLRELAIMQCGLKNLEGIEKFPEIQSLCLGYNRQLVDIKELSSVFQSLHILDIENCPKITDFSVLEKLKNLEILSLSGNNELPNLNFIKELKNLKMFMFSMNIQDGDLTPCLNIPYVDSGKNRKHYNLKNKDLPKNFPQI